MVNVHFTEKGITTMRWQYLFLALVVGSSDTLLAAECLVVSDLGSFVNTAMTRDPRRREKELAADMAQQKKSALRNSALLPELSIASAVGPAPEYTITRDNAGIQEQTYDFSKIGPFFGFEFNAIQPLNFHRYQNGIQAADCNIELSKQEIKKNVVEMNRYFQEIYFKALYACQMVALCSEARRTLRKAIVRLDSLLEEDAPTISQNNALELKSYVFKVDDGLYQAENGMDAAKSAMTFSLNADTVVLKDTLLYLRNEKLPGLDSMKVLLRQNHPDIKRLASAIEAQKALVSIARAEMFPDAFIAGSFKFTRSWNDQHYAPGSLEHLLDPFNQTTGSLGIGVRFNMNVWSTKEKYGREKLELETLLQKEAYAEKALVLQLENQYKTVVMHYKRQTSAAASLQSADAWLKGAAMKFDLDPSQVEGLLKAYEKNVEAQKDYYECVLDYDIAMAGLIAETGLTLDEYDTIIAGSKTFGVIHE